MVVPIGMFWITTRRHTDMLAYASMPVIRSTPGLCGRPGNSAWTPVPVFDLPGDFGAMVDGGFEAAAAQLQLQKHVLHAATHAIRAHCAGEVLEEVQSGWAQQGRCYSSESKAQLGLRSNIGLGVLGRPSHPEV